MMGVLFGPHFVTGLVWTASERNSPFCSFPRSRRLRDSRQQLPRNVQKTLNSPETKKTKKAKTTKKNKKGRRKAKKKGANKTKKRKRAKQKIQKCKHDRDTKKQQKETGEIHSNPIYTNPIKNFPKMGVVPFWHNSK